MSLRHDNFDIDAALVNPSRYFAEPDDILVAPGLRSDEKIRLLKQWEHDARLLAIAEEENMGGGEETKLGRVLNALKAIKG